MHGPEVCFSCQSRNWCQQLPGEEEDASYRGDHKADVISEWVSGKGDRLDEVTEYPCDGSLSVCYILVVSFVLHSPPNFADPHLHSLETLPLHFHPASVKWVQWDCFPPLLDCKGSLCEQHGLPGTSGIPVPAVPHIQLCLAAANWQQSGCQLLGMWAGCIFLRSLLASFCG